MGVSYGLDIDQSNVTMQTLRALDTTKDLHYTTTLALAYIPSALVDKLSLDLHTKADKIYRHHDPPVRRVMSMINPAFPIRASDELGGSATSPVGGSPSSTNSGFPNEGAPIGGGMDGSQPVKPVSVGIALGVACGAAAYGAAMFYVARRYKNRRLSHGRSPSMFTSPNASRVGSPQDYLAGGAGTALMSGAHDDGGRSVSPANGLADYGRDSRGSGRSGSSGRQQISAPVMAENSLGWN